MFRITFDINGREIGCIGVWNTQERRLEDEEHRIRYQIHDIRGHKDSGGSVKDYPLIEDIWYREEGGAAGLAERVMKEVEPEHFDRKG